MRNSDPGLQVGFRFFLVGEETGAFQDDVYVMRLPGDFGRVLMCVYFYLIAAYDDGVLGSLYFFRETALCTVVFQQVSQNLGAGQIVNCHYFYSFQTMDLAESQTSDPAKTIDSNFNCAHRC